MSRVPDTGSGATYEAGPTGGDPLPWGGVAAGEGLDLGAAKLQAAAGGAPGMRDPGAMPFGAGDSAAADLPSGNTWAAPAGQG
jgi:hypothetical protein